MDPVARDRSEAAFPVGTPTGAAGHGRARRPTAALRGSVGGSGRVKLVKLATSSVLLALGQAALSQAAPPARAPSGWRPTVQLQDRPPQQAQPPASALYRRDLHGDLAAPARVMVGPEWTGSRGLRLALLVPVEPRPFSPTSRTADAGTWSEPLQGAQVQMGMKLHGFPGNRTSPIQEVAISNMHRALRDEFLFP